MADTPGASGRRQPGHGGITEERVKTICSLMASGRWVTHLSAQQLAATWGIKPQTVNNLACEASRRLRALVHESPDMRARIVTMLEKIVQECMAKGERRTAVEAIRVMFGVIEAGKEQNPELGVRHTVIVEEVTQAQPSNAAEDARAEHTTASSSPARAAVPATAAVPSRPAITTRAAPPKT